jgi:hypothetical protein
LGALFSGFGVADLASAAFTRFRAAGQLGISPGALASFQVNMQQFLGTAALEAAANAQIDVTKAGGLAALGIGWQHAQSISPSQLAFEELKSAALLYQKAQKTGTPAMQVPGIALYTSLLGGNIGDVRNAAMNMGALNAANAARQRDAGILGFSQQTAQAWANLHITLDKAGLSIQSALIDSLAPLAPQIAVLADDVASFIRAFVKSPEFGVIVNDVATGLKEFGAWLKGPDPKAMWTNIKLLGEEIGVIAQKFAWLLPAPTNPGPHPGLDVTNPGHQAFDWLFALPGAVSHIESTFGAVRGAAAATIASVAHQLGVNPLLALATAIQESGLDPSRKGDYSEGKPTSFGLFQLHQGGELGALSVAQAFDATTNARRALAVVAQVARAHPGWSPGQIAAAAQRPEYPVAYARAVDAIYTRLATQAAAFRGASTASNAETSIHGTSWVAHLHKDMAAFVSAKKQLSGGPQASTDITPLARALKSVLRHRTPKPAHVSITNSTAARVAVSVNAVAVS